MGEREEKILFVGRLPSGTTALDLKTIFGRVIYNKERLIVDRVDVKGHYGFVYVRGRNLSKLVDYLNPQFINDIKIKIEYARINEIEKIKSRQNYPENRTLFVTDFLPNYNNSKEFNRLFGKYGKLAHLAIKTKFAFVEYQNINDAIYAKKKLDGYSYNGRQLTVSYAATKNIKKEEKRRYLQFPGYDNHRGDDARFNRRNRYKSYSSSHSRSRNSKVSRSRSRTRSRDRDRHRYRSKDKHRYRDRSRDRYNSYSGSRSVSKSKSKSKSNSVKNNSKSKTDPDDGDNESKTKKNTKSDDNKSNEKDNQIRSTNKDNQVNRDKDTLMDDKS